MAQVQRQRPIHSSASEGLRCDASDDAASTAAWIPVTIDVSTARTTVIEHPPPMTVKSNNIINVADRQPSIINVSVEQADLETLRWVFARARSEVADIDPVDDYQRFTRINDLVRTLAKILHQANRASTKSVVDVEAPSAPTVASPIPGATPDPDPVLISEFGTARGQDAADVGAGLSLRRPRYSVSREVARAFVEEPDRDFSVAELCELADGASESSVRGALRELLKHDSVVRSKRGQYRAPARAPIE